MLIEIKRGRMHVKAASNTWSSQANLRDARNRATHRPSGILPGEIEQQGRQVAQTITQRQADADAASRLNSCIASSLSIVAVLATVNCRLSGVSLRLESL